MISAVTIGRPPDSATLADSPYARELQRGVSHLGFAAPLEAAFLQARLCESRLLIRVASLLSALVALLRITERLYADDWALFSIAGLAFVIVSSLALAAIAWSPLYQRHYLLWARTLVPTRNSLVAVQIAAAAAHGQLEMLMVLPIALFGPFFFLGLRYREALLCSAVTVLAYGIAATAWGVPAAIAIRSYVFLFIALIAFIVAARHLEKSSRLAFLKGHLITELAQHDSLTGAKNRRVFDEHLSDLWQRAAEQGRSIAILLIDIDYFKAYNDCYGHQAGDRTLCRVAQVLGSFVRRPTDLLARYGGEEFAAVFDDTEIGAAGEVAEKMRRAVAELNIEHHGSPAWRRVSISLGVAAVTPSEDRSPDGALQLADQALYEAKVAGRDRVQTRGETHHDLVVTGVFAVGAGAGRSFVRR